MNEALISKAAACLYNGDVIAYPTEAVWGLGCDPKREMAVQALLRLKQRPIAKGLILIAANIAQLTPYLTELKGDQYQRLQASWPGFQTWVVPAPESVPAWIKGKHAGIALRVSAHPTVQALCEAFGGPLVSTSANPAGFPAARTAEQVSNYFSDRLGFILPGEVGGASSPSRIIDIVSGKLLR